RSSGRRPCQRVAPLRTLRSSHSAQAPELHAFLLQETFGVPALQHGERGIGAGLRAGIRSDRDGARSIGGGPTRACVDDVAVTLAIRFDAMTRVAARGQGADAQLDHLLSLTARRGGFDADLPRGL